MREDIIYKLKTLQSIEPEAVWQADKKRKLMEKISVFGVRNDIFLSSSDIYATQNKFDIRSFLPRGLAVSLTSFAVVFASGLAALGASQSSLPGDALYPVKKASENVALAIASEQDKPKVEIEQAGKRLEELAKISQKASDSNQHQKVEVLVSEFQQKVASANDHLTKLNEKEKSGSGVKVASVAKVVNEQSEKYTEVLQKTTESLPGTVKERVAVKVAEAANTTEKINLSSLMVMVEFTEPQNADEIVAKVQKTIEKAEVRVNELSVQTAAAATQSSACAAATEANKAENIAPASCPLQDKAVEGVVMTEEARGKLEEAKASLKNSNLTDTLKSVSQVTEIAAQVAPASVAVPVQPVQTSAVPASVPAAVNTAPVQN